MKIVSLDKDLKSSALGLGTWGLGGPNDVGTVSLGWPYISDSDAIQTIKTAVDEGILFFDTSDFYGAGRAEVLLGKATHNVKDKIVIATKGGLLPRLVAETGDPDRDFTATRIRAAVEGSLRRLDRDWIDIYQLHGPDESVLDNDDLWLMLDELKQAGKIRYVGVSLRSRCTNLSLWSKRNLTCLQLRYNILHTAESVRIDEGETALLKIVARSPIEHGLLTGRFTDRKSFEPHDHRRHKYDPRTAQQICDLFSRLKRMSPTLFEDPVEVCLRYVLGSPKVTVTLVGCTNSDQVRINARIARKCGFSPSEREAIRSLATESFGN